MAAVFEAKVSGTEVPRANESNGIDGVLEVDEAAKVAGNITDDCRAQANGGNSKYKSRISPVDSCGRNKGKDEFPGKGEEVHDVIAAGRHLLLASLSFFIFIVIIFGLYNKSV